MLAEGQMGAQIKRARGQGSVIAALGFKRDLVAQMTRQMVGPCACCDDQLLGLDHAVIRVDPHPGFCGQDVTDRGDLDLAARVTQRLRHGFGPQFRVHGVEPVGREGRVGKAAVQTRLVFGNRLGAGQVDGVKAVLFLQLPRGQGRAIGFFALIERHLAFALDQIFALDMRHLSFKGGLGHMHQLSLCLHRAFIPVAPAGAP